MSRLAGARNGAAAIAALLLALWAPAAARADFGFLPGAEGFAFTALAEGGVPATQAGSHPFELTAAVALKLEEGTPEPGGPYTDGDLKDLQIEEPPGLIENPAAVAQCTTAQFNTPRISPFEASRSGESCPDKSQVGVITLHSSLAGAAVRSFGLFNLVPPPGSPSRLGANVDGTPIVFTPRIRQADGEYGVTLGLRELSQRFDVYGFTLHLWGVPWSVAHNTERGNCLNEGDPEDPWAKCSVGRPRLNPAEAYLTLPASCSGPLAATATADSWQRPGALRPDGEPDLADPAWQRATAAAAGLQECDRLSFAPEARGRLTTARAASPSGFDLSFDISEAGLENPKLTAPSQPEKLVLSLPEGITIDPSMAAGLGACAPARYEAETVDSAPGAGCPEDSKIGDLTVTSPLFEEQLTGSVFLAQPGDNPFGSLIALYIVAKAPQRGVLVKLAGGIEADPVSGRLVASFEGLPQLPYSHFEVTLREGQRSPLLTPPSCGTYAATVALSPWLSPLSALQESSPLGITSGPEGGPCPPAGAQRFAPAVEAGALNPQAGAYSPFFLHLSRADTEAEITSYSATLPTGVTARLAGVAYCPEAAIAAAARASGTAEEEHPSCPATSQIGRTVAGYGVGPVLAYAPGRLYLAGPWRGSPLSVVAVDSAKVGPFDLGTIVIRSALRVDPRTAALSIDSAASDPIPHILDGIPLHLRDIRVYIDRPGFTLNPTSCEPAQLGSTLSGSSAPFADPRAERAAVAVRFQASNCGALGFVPKLSLSLHGAKRRAGYPALRAVLRPRPGDANLGGLTITMPHAEFLAQNHIGGVCTNAQFDAGACPAASVYGVATAFTPLLAGPLRGPVYLRSSDNPLPDLAIELSEGPIRVVLDGRIDSVGNGRIRAVFEGLPDAPVTKFVFEMRGGRRGALVNSADLCAGPLVAVARLVGQNGKGAALHPRLAVHCPRRGKHRHRNNHHHRRTRR